jgi:hypothetical protein
LKVFKIYNEKKLNEGVLKYDFTLYDTDNDGTNSYCLSALSCSKSHLEGDEKSISLVAASSRSVKIWKIDLNSEKKKYSNDTKHFKMCKKIDYTSENDYEEDTEDEEEEEENEEEEEEERDDDNNEENEQQPKKNCNVQ